MKTGFIVIFCLFLNIYCEGLQQKTYEPLKTTIIIPCYYKHFCHIPELLDCFEKQTVLPDEIVISLNPIDKFYEIPDDLFDSVVISERPFKVKVIFDIGGSPGIARNAACEKASGDILICQDADDIPHPQRVEIIKNLFENFKVNFLIHCWIPSGSEFKPYSESETFFFAQYFENYRDINVTETQHGSVCLRREVFEKLKWSSTYTGQGLLIKNT